MDLTVSEGQLIAVVGSTGSGKSSLLSAALGLMEQQSGPEVEVYGNVSILAPNHLLGYRGLLAGPVKHNQSKDAMQLCLMLSVHFKELPQYKV